MSTVVAQPGTRPRWADVFDSSQEDSQREVLPGPPVHQDSYQDSQASQVASQGFIEQMRQTELSPEKLRKEMPTVSEGKALVRRSHVTEEAVDEAMSSWGSSGRRQKRQWATEAESSKRQKADQPMDTERRFPRRPRRQEEEGSEATEDTERRLQKRRQVIAAHKDRDDYQAFNERNPRHLRDDTAPMTPDPTQHPSKRQWETVVQRWREGLRVWYAAQG